MDIEQKDIHTTLEPYTKYQELSYKIADLMNNNSMFTDDDRISMGDCGEWLTFEKTENGYRLHSANFCRKRYCPMCQWRKSEKQFANCLTISKSLIEQGYSFLHMVLTVPNCNGGVELVKTIKNLFYSFSKLKNYKKVKRAFKGILRCLEISYNYDTHTFHPHLHCLVAVRKSYFNDSRLYISYDELRSLWSKANNSEQLLQCSLRKISGNDNLGFAEVSKYCLKPLDLKEEKDVENSYILYSLAYTLKGQRFTQAYGVIKEELKKIKDNDENELTESNTEQMFVYKWDYQFHKYYRIGGNNAK